MKTLNEYGIYRLTYNDNTGYYGLYKTTETGTELLVESMTVFLPCSVLAGIIVNDEIEKERQLKKL